MPQVVAPPEGSEGTWCHNLWHDVGPESSEPRARGRGGKPSALMPEVAERVAPRAWGGLQIEVGKFPTLPSHDQRSESDGGGKDFPESGEGRAGEKVFKN